MQGHAGANLMPLVAANRIGHEIGRTGDITFYGSSFIADNTGAIVAEAGRDEEVVIVANFDVEGLRNQRAAWGLFRDRRPELYGPIVTLDGQSESPSR
jgi:N-carbamoylputrescine amidase